MKYNSPNHGKNVSKLKSALLSVQVEMEMERTPILTLKLRLSGLVQIRMDADVEQDILLSLLKPNIWLKKKHKYVTNRFP